MKDTNQKTKEAKKFRLHSILKLHTRIMNQKLMKHAVSLANILEKVKTADKEVVFNELTDCMVDFAVIGSHNFDVSNMANNLQLTSSQEELQVLFKLVTKSEKDIRKDLVKELEEENKCKCSCTESKAKSTEPNTKQVKAKVIEIVATSKEDALEQIRQILKEGKIK